MRVLWGAYGMRVEIMWEPFAAKLKAQQDTRNSVAQNFKTHEHDDTNSYTSVDRREHRPHATRRQQNARRPALTLGGAPGQRLSSPPRQAALAPVLQHFRT